MSVSADLDESVEEAEAKEELLELGGPCTAIKEVGVVHLHRKRGVKNHTSTMRKEIDKIVGT